MKFVIFNSAANGNPLVINAAEVRVLRSDPNDKKPKTQIHFDNEHSVMVAGSLDEIAQKLMA